VSTSVAILTAHQKKLIDLCGRLPESGLLALFAKEMGVTTTKVRILHLPKINALVVESADAADSKSASERSGGSSPSWGTNLQLRSIEA